MRRVKNNTQQEGVWSGMTIPPGEYYEIQPVELQNWRLSDKVATSLVNGELIINDGTRDIVNPAEAINFLQGVTRNTLPISVDVSDISLNVFQRLGQLVWMSERNAAYKSGILIVEVAVSGGVGVQLRVVNVTRNVVLGLSPVYTTSGIKTFAINKPSEDCRIEIQCKHNSLLSLIVKPQVHCAIMEWDT